MSIVYLVVGTVLTILFIILLFRGSKYDYLLDVLDSGDFPLKSIYSVGLAWQDMKIFKLRGKLGESLRSDTTLHYSRKYSEFYARAIWAQMLSYGHICLAVFLVAAGAATRSMSNFFLMVGMILCILELYYFGTYTKEKVKKRREECDLEFPNAVSKLALIVNSGATLHDSWEMVAYGKDGTFYDMMKNSCAEMNNGKAGVDAIHDMGALINSEEIKKFTSALIQSIERGGGDLPYFLANQSSELWAKYRQNMLQKGEKAASALLMPIALMFLGIMLIVMSAAMQSF